MFTYHDPNDETDKYPHVKSYHLSVALHLFTGNIEKENIRKAGTEEIASNHWKEIPAIAALFDPFSKVHLSSAILPTASVQWPKWSPQQAMQKMTVFHMEPSLFTDSKGLNFDETKVFGGGIGLGGSGEDKKAREKKEGEEDEKVKGKRKHLLNT